MKHAPGLLRFWLATLGCLLMAMAFSASAVQAQLVKNPDDFKIKVKWRHGTADKNGDRLGGDAEIILSYNPPGGPDISRVQARLMSCGAGEVHEAFPDYAEPPMLWVNNDDSPTLLQPALDDNGVPTGLLEVKIPWPTRLFHNGPHLIAAGLEVTVFFVNGGTQVLNYESTLTLIVRNLTIDDLTGVTPLPPTAELAWLGEPQNGQAVAPRAEPSFIWPQGGDKTFTCVLNSALSSGVKLRYEVFSCDNPDEILTTHQTMVSTPGLDAAGQSTPSINTWQWDGTKTVGVWDENEGYHEEQVPVGRGLYQVRITAEVYEDSGEGSGSSIVDSDSTRSTRTCWPAYSMYSPAITLAYDSLLAGGTRQLNVNYALRLSGQTIHIVGGAATRLEAFTRVYDPAPGDLERVGDVVEGPAATDVINPSLTLNQAELQLPWNDKANRAEKVLLTAKDHAGFDRGHREKWNLGQTRKVIDGEAESVIYQVTSPATATAPEGLRRVTNNQIVGGKCYVGVEMEISAGGYLFNRFYSLKITEDPDTGHGVTHPGTQDHIYFLLAASRPGGASSVWIPGVPAENQPRWQLWNASLLKWEEAPQAHGPLDHRSAKRERWRVLIPWQTATAAQMPDAGTPYYSTLLGHNGPHTFKVNNMQDSSLLIQNTSNVTFACDELTYGNSYNNYAMSHSVEIDKATDKANVQNLVINNVSSNGNVDYFKWDPLGDDPLMKAPQVSFTIEDQGDPHKYKWVMWFKETKKIHTTNNDDWTSDAYCVTGIKDSAGQVVVNLTDPTLFGHLDEAIHARGPYTYDIRVTEYEGTIPPGVDETGAIDRAQFKQPYMEWIPNSFNLSGQNQSHSGHEVWYEYPEDSSDINLKANYYLFPNPATGNLGLANIQLTPMDPQFMERTPNASVYQTPNMTKPGLWHGGEVGLHIYTITPDDEDGEWRVIFTGDDASGPSRRRSHDCQRMIPVNDKKNIFSILPFTKHEHDDAVRSDEEGYWYAFHVDTARVFKRTSHNSPAKLVKERVKALSTDLRPNNKLYSKWVGVNGGYTANQGDNLGAIGIGTAGNWHRGWPVVSDNVEYPNQTDPDPPTKRYFRRWAFGMTEQNSPTPKHDFKVGLGEWRTINGEGGYWYPITQPAPGDGHSMLPFPYGIDNLQALIVDGEPKVMRLPTAEGGSENDGKDINGTNVRTGIDVYLHLPYQDWSGQLLYTGYQFSAIGTSSDGRHMYLLVDKRTVSSVKDEPLGNRSRDAVGIRDLFRKWTNKATHDGNTMQIKEVYRESPNVAIHEQWKKWVTNPPYTPGEVVSRMGDIRDFYTKKKTVDTISNALLFDGGSDMQFFYRKRIKKGVPQEGGEKKFTDIKYDEGAGNEIAGQVEAHTK